MTQITILNADAPVGALTLRGVALLGLKGHDPVITAATPSCWRALRNTEALLRRAERQAERD
jgi:hypothetical protein